MACLAPEATPLLFSVLAPLHASATPAKRPRDENADDVVLLERLPKKLRRKVMRAQTEPQHPDPDPYDVYPSVIVHQHHTALTLANLDHAFPLSPTLKIYFTDCSVQNAAGRAAVAVAWNAGDDWAGFGECYKYGNVIGSTLTAEALAVGRALWLAGETCKDETGFMPVWQKKVVRVWTDCMDVCKYLYDGIHAAADFARPALCWCLDAVKKLAEKFGVWTEVRWVPGHSGVRGNVIADVIAGFAAKQWPGTWSFRYENGVLLRHRTSATPPEPVPDRGQTNTQDAEPKVGEAMKTILDAAQAKSNPENDESEQLQFSPLWSILPSN